MKIALVAPSPVPYVVGGAERLWMGLVEALSAEGHEVEMVKLPSPERNADEIIASYRAFSTLDVSHFDRVITSKYPGWMVQHPRHIVYIMHTLRGLYDTYHVAGLPTAVDRDRLLPASRDLAVALDGPPERARVAEVLDLAAVAAHESIGSADLALPSPLLRMLVHWLDRIGLGDPGVERILAISATVAARSYYPPGVRPAGVPPPSGLRLERGPAERNGFFTASRLDGPKRVDLLIDAWKDVPGEHELVIAGNGPREAELRARAASDSRIRFLGRVDDEVLVDQYQRARAVLFVPENEDLGLITLEAFQAATPVITTTDSGGVAELVDHGRSGLVVEPTAPALARAVARIAHDPMAAAAMGRAGAERAASVTWRSVLDALLGDRAPARPRIVVLSTYPIEPAIGGGQRRSRHLFAPLMEQWDVHYVCLGFPDQEPATTNLADGIVQTIVARSPEHEQLEEQLTLRAGIPLSDIASTMVADRTPDLVAAVRAAAEGADLAVLAQPYLLPVLRDAKPNLPFILDAQNDEAVMKADMLPRTPDGAALVDVVAEVERAASLAAARVVVCSEPDGRSLARHRLPGALAPVLVCNGTDVAGTRFVTGTERADRSARWRAAWQRAGGVPAERLTIFVGSWHPPNLDAAEGVFAAAAAMPRTVFVVAGSQCAAYTSRLLPDNVVLRGQVADRELAALLAAADVALNPMRLGSGTNLKAVEYFAAGVPVVSTAFGVRGLGAKPGVHYVEIADHVDLPVAIERAHDSQRSTPRVAAARALVERDFDWSLLARRFRDVVDDVVAETGSSEHRRPFRERVP